MFKETLLATVLASAALGSQAHAVSLVFDYTYDANGFFNTGTSQGTTARNLLESAGSYFSNLLTDDFDAITSSGVNHFNARFTNPATGATTQIDDYSVNADEVVVFAGGRSLSGSTLGQGGPGGYGASGTSTFLTGIATRGETATSAGVSGSSASEFAPWGGAITFDTDRITGSNGDALWYFDSDTSTLDVPAGTADFYSVALHELGHLLGIGTADSWDNLINGGTEFTGAASVAEYGGNVPIDSGLGHWADGTNSNVDGTAQEAAMDPSILLGSRKVFTALDVAGLDDIGYDIAATTPVPVPPSIWLLNGGLLGIAGWRLRQRA